MHMFSLKLDVWLSIAPKSCYFCWECANKLAQVKLGRCLTEEDLKPGIPCNERFIARNRKAMSKRHAIVIRDVREFDAPWRVIGTQWAIVDDSDRIVAVARNEDEAKDKLRELEDRHE
jgi:hypothetical protein